MIGRGIRVALSAGLCMALSALAPVAAHADVEVANVAEAAGLAGQSRSWSVAVADIDLDGRPDLAISRHEDPGAIFLAGDGGFQEVAPGTLVANDRHDCAWADVDLDHRPDLYCTVGAEAGTAVKANELWLQQPGGGFVESAAAWGVTDPYGRGRRTTFVDANGDAFPDLFVGNEYPRQDAHASPDRLFLNQDGAGFAEAEGWLHGRSGANCAIAADQDGDGWQDLLVCGQERLLLLHNLQGRGFREVGRSRGVEGQPQSAALADLDGDGRLDLVKMGFRELSMQHQRRDGTFGPSVHLRGLSKGRWLATGDVDADGDVDLYVVQSCLGGRDRIDLLLRNRNGGTRFIGTDSPRVRHGCGDVAAAFNADHDPELEIVVLNGHGKVDSTLAVGPIQLLDLRRTR